MGQGLTNGQYATWLNETASEDCSSVAEIYIKYANDSTQTLTNSSDICEWMEGTGSTVIATINEVKFSGIADGEPWQALDERLQTNLERTLNLDEVPVKIRRPTGT